MRCVEQAADPTRDAREALHPVLGTKHTRRADLTPRLSTGTMTSQPSGCATPAGSPTGAAERFASVIAGQSGCSQRVGQRAGTGIAEKRSLAVRRITRSRSWLNCFG